MCFSAEASFTGAAVLASVGVATLLKAPNKKAIPLALLPLLLAIHQAIEGIVWLTYDDPSWFGVQKFVSYLFLILATAVWPLWIPGSLYLLEKKRDRKGWILKAGMVGIFVSAAFLLSLARDGSDTLVIDHSISYSFISDRLGAPYQWDLGKFLVIGYSFAVIAPLFFSSLRFTSLLGVAISLGLVVSAIFYAYAFGSVWCFFGALCSVLVYFVIKNCRFSSN